MKKNYIFWFLNSPISIKTKIYYIYLIVEQHFIKNYTNIFYVIYTFS